MSHHELLKEATRANHDRIEVTLQSERILSPDLKLDDYARHLQAIHYGHYRVESGLLPFQTALEKKGFSLPSPSNHSLIAKDLATLESDQTHHPVNPSVFNNQTEAIGALYVIMGSAMGRTMIARRLAPKIKEWNLAAPAYYTTEASGIDEWKAFIQQLNALPLSAETTQQLIRGAVGAFESFDPDTIA
jgi:heme oxygenase